MVLGVYTGTAVNALTSVGSNDDGCNPVLFNEFGSYVEFQAQAGTEYRIAVDVAGPETGNFKIFVALYLALCRRAGQRRRRQGGPGRSRLQQPE